MANTITVNTENLKRLRAAYKQALADAKESFIFDGSELLTSYAKYLIEYMETLLNKKK